MSRRNAIFGCLSTLAAACGSGETKPSTSNAVTNCPVVVNDADCDKSQRPIVFIHGTFGSGDNIGNVAALFGSNGFCQDRFLAVEYNSLGGDPLAQLDAIIDQTLAATGLDKVDLMGHSQGTRHAYTYLSDPAHAAKVAHYVHLAGGPQAAPPGGVPTLSISSMSDTIATAVGVTGAEKTVVLQDQDHFAVAASTPTFVAIYNYLRGKDPQYTEVQCGEDPVTIVGISETFGDNTPAPGRVEIYELGTAPRDRGAPVATVTIGADGVVGPWMAKRLQAYELKGFDATGKQIGHSYFSPFKRSNRLLRLLVPSSGLTKAVTDAIVVDDRHTAITARYIAGAFRKDLGDSLTVDGVEVLNDQIAVASTSTVGLFLFDANLNQQTDGGSLAAYASTPFVKGTDVFMQASTPAFVQLKLNGKLLLQIPNWPSASEGPSLIMLGP